MLDLADDLKACQRERESHRLLEGRTLGLLFRKHSTRTRVSLEVAAAHLGANALYLPAAELQLARGESVEDTARVLSGYLDALAIRTHAHAEVEAFAATATVPVVNALTDEAHPLQALADLLTVRERFGTLEGLKVAWTGTGTTSAPRSRKPARCSRSSSPAPRRPATSRRASAPLPTRARRREARTSSPTSGRAWARRSRRRLGAPPSPAISSTTPCSPRPIPKRSCSTASRASREEIAADVLYGPRSAVWDEAENRLHTAKALLALTVL